MTIDDRDGLAALERWRALELSQPDGPPPNAFDLVGSRAWPLEGGRKASEATEDLTGQVDSAPDTAPESLSPAPLPVLARPRANPGGDSRLERRRRRKLTGRARVAAVLLLVAGAGLIGYGLGSTSGSGEPVYLSPVTGEPVELGVVPERGTASIWQPDAPTLRIPLLEVEAPLGIGTDGGPGPVVLQGTPWPGEPGRSVLLVNANLEPLRTGDLISIEHGDGGVAVWRVTTTIEVEPDQLDSLAVQPPAGRSELLLVEASDEFRDGGRIVARTWKVVA